MKIIAEIGWNHCGDMILAKEMASAAKENGADYAKYQTWSTSRLTTGPWDEDGRRQIYEAAELSYDDHIELIQHCKTIGIKFLSSAFSVADAKLLKELNCVDIKIPSFESRNHELIKYCNENFLNVFMSTGTSTLKEVRQSAKILKDVNLCLMHCVSSYPCLPSSANIKKIHCLKRICANVGYSDHIMGVESAKVAIGMGAEVIEKHFTIDNNLPGRDNKFAILPPELKNLKEYITLRQMMMVYHGEDYLPCENESREKYSGRFNKSD